ncbi:hypothetical protein ACOM2C_06210 [Pseudarthrobacter sp. So.54]
MAPHERDSEFVGYMDLLSAAARDAGFTVATRRIAGCRAFLGDRLQRAAVRA